MDEGVQFLLLGRRKGVHLTAGGRLSRDKFDSVVPRLVVREDIKRLF